MTQAAENIFLPVECNIVRAMKVTDTEKHFTLKRADGEKVKFDPGQITIPCAV